MAAVGWKCRVLASLARMALVRRLHVLGKGSAESATYSPLFTVVLDQLRSVRLTRCYLVWNKDEATLRG